MSGEVDIAASPLLLSEATMTGTKIPGGWKRFHRFNSYEKEDNKRAAQRANDFKIEARQLKDHAVHSPKIAKMIGEKSSQTRRMERIKVTLPNIWRGKDVSGD